MKHSLRIGALLFLLAVAALLLWQNFAGMPANNIDAKKNLIQVDNVKPNDEIASPFTVTGTARGVWFFEASFPVRVVDARGTVLGTGIAQAQGEWMTTEFVPFSAPVTFAPSATETGTLVLEKDNPSGLPEHADALIIPIRFGTPHTGTQTMQVFFGSSRADAVADCTIVFPAERIIPTTSAVARAALEELLKGPTDAEKERFLITSIPEGVRIQRLAIEDGVAKVDLSEELERGVGGSCRVTHIRAQIERTLKQFPTVQEVVISINGRTEDILQP